jgi:hypothetical protein
MMEKAITIIFIFIIYIYNQLDWTYCQYCGTTNLNWKKKDVYSHQKIDCYYLVQCKYCQALLKIDELNLHLVLQCSNKNNFVFCNDCGFFIILEYYYL